MSKPFDATLKQLVDAFSPDWVGWLAPMVGLSAGVEADPLDADVSTVQFAADKVFRLRPPAVGLLHLELQSSWDGELPARLLHYNVLLEARYGGPVYTVAILLRREANSPAVDGTLVRAYPDGREYLRFGYGVVRVWELPADQLLDSGTGTMPLALLTDDAAPHLAELVPRFAKRAELAAPTGEAFSLLLVAGYILLGMRYDKNDIRPLFQGLQQMRESSTFQAILDEGRAEGAVETRQDDLLSLLEDRFGTVVPELVARIRATSDLAKLRTALLRVGHIASPDELAL